MTIIKDLLETNCIKEGKFKLKNGDISKYYFDIKNIVSYPKLVKKIGDKIYKLIDKEQCDLICGVPIGGIPVCSYISTTYNIPMIMVRNEIKQYGSCKQIEGNYNKNNNCIIIEDVITTGCSVQRTIDILQGKVNVIGVIVIIDRQQNYQCSVPVNSLVTKTEIVRERLLDVMEKKKSRLCFSADIEDPSKLFMILDKIGQYIVVCKIHSDIYKHKDGRFKEIMIELSIKHNFLIMEDRKYVDISHITRKQHEPFQNWIDIVTVMAFVSNDVIKGLSGALIVAGMSNNHWDMTEHAVALAQHNPRNVLGFITQKRIKEGNCLCFTPGISLSNTSFNDQKYTPIQDVDTDLFIVGRDIYNHENYEYKANLYSTM